jgi:hypothetical protein
MDAYTVFREALKYETLNSLAQDRVGSVLKIHS